MKLKNLGAHMNVIETKDVSVLFSYETPVAAFVSGQGYFRTSKYWSRTTSRHINVWLDGMDAQEKPQEWFDTLLDEKTPA